MICCVVGTTTIIIKTVNAFAEGCAFERARPTLLRARLIHMVLLYIRGLRLQTWNRMMSSLTYTIENIIGLLSFE